MQESVLLTNRHVLVCLQDTDATKDLKKHFCGKVLSNVYDPHIFSKNTLVYLCGDIQHAYNTVKHVLCKAMLVVTEASYNYSDVKGPLQFISSGQVPLNVHGVGVYFRKFFAADVDYFKALNAEHKFQDLTESNKPGVSFRRGLYLSEVKENKGDLHFHLLRCSTNLSGPTEQFQKTDRDIIEKANAAALDFFQNPAPLNHVLAQVYLNTGRNKAKISAHSDKTKDMPQNGVMAFCTFYETNGVSLLKQSQDDPFDLSYNGVRALTKLHFKLKGEVKDDLVKEFSVILYPNSMFLMPLSTNRLYTHDIRPSDLPAKHIPTRLGYVIRCSNRRALSRDGETYIEDGDGEYVKMQPITEEDRRLLKQLYYEENATTQMVKYPPIYFSMNDGDYKAPLCSSSSE
jgi:hypothetical protein